MLKRSGARRCPARGLVCCLVAIFATSVLSACGGGDDTVDATKLVNDDTVLRATATFLRTAVTRNTPFDRVLAGADALTTRQRRGARLFFTKAEQGGAGCFSCRSGPMLNKQPNDPDVRPTCSTCRSTSRSAGSLPTISPKLCSLRISSCRYKFCASTGLPSMRRSERLVRSLGFHRLWSLA